MIDAKIKKLYHCTARKNFESILMEGLNEGIDGFVYFAPTAKDAALFMMLHGLAPEDMLVFEIKRSLLDDERLDYSADHSKAFFGCEAYVYRGAIPRHIVWKAKIYDVTGRK